MSPETPEKRVQTPAKVGGAASVAEPQTAETVLRLHEIYNAKTGAELRLRPPYATMWKTLLEDYTGDAPALSGDVQLVVRYLKKQIDAGKRYPGALKLVNLLNPEQFAADLAEAKIVLRPAKPRPVPVAVTTALPDGSSVTRAGQRDPGKHEPEPIQKSVREQAAEFRRKMGYPEGREN